MLELKHSFNPQNKHILAKEKASVHPVLWCRSTRLRSWCGGHESPGAGRSARGPPKVVCGSRLLCHRDPAEVLASHPCAGHQHLLGSGKENGARDVAANLPARWCTGALIQESPTFVPGERGGLLEQEHMTSWISPDLNSIENLWGILEAEFTKAEPCSSIQQLAVLLKLAWANFKPATLRKLVAGMPQRVARCLTMNGKHIEL